MGPPDPPSAFGVAGVELGPEEAFEILPLGGLEPRHERRLGQERGGFGMGIQMRVELIDEFIQEAAERPRHLPDPGDVGVVQPQKLPAPGEFLGGRWWPRGGLGTYVCRPC